MNIELLESAFEELTGPSDPLFNWRKKSWDRFLELGPPERKQEAFRYVPLQHLAIPSPSLAPSMAPFPAPLICLPLETAMRSYGLFLQNRMTQLLKEETDPFAALNGAFAQQSWFVYVPPKVQASVELCHRFPSAAALSPRIHLYLGAGAQLEWIQRVEGSGFGNVLIDVVLDAQASLSFFDCQRLAETAQSFSSLRAKLKRESRLFYVSCSRGSLISRTSINVQLSEEQSEVKLRGLSALSGGQCHHIHTQVEHQAPHAKSHQHFKMVLEDQSVASFEGKILVQPAAQKTESYQMSQTLLLSDTAKAYAKPNLEIFADDVKASHGSTTGHLNADALFYLRSRGLMLQEARQWLINGFCQEILDLLPETLSDA